MPKTDRDAHPRTAILVVHGIGKPPAGATVDRLVDSLAATTDGLAESGTRSQVALRDLDRRDGRASTFPCHVREARHPAAGEFVFAEVWWGHRAPTRGGIGATLALLWSAFGVIVGLGTVFRTANRTAPTLPRAANLCGSVSSVLLTGPVFAANLVAMVLVAVSAAMHHVPQLREAPRTSLIAGAVVALLVAVVLLVAVAARRKGTSSGGGAELPMM